MNTDNLHRIFDSTTCISTEKMIEYLDDNLLDKEKNSVELHLSSCSMCYDEFEGLQSISDKSKLSNTVFELNDKIDTILESTKKTIPFLMPINLMAAIILFIIGFAWYVTYYIDATFRLKNELVSQSLEKELSYSEGEIIILRPESALSEKTKDEESINAYKRLLEEENQITNPVSSDKKTEGIKKEAIKENLEANTIITETEKLDNQDDLNVARSEKAITEDLKAKNEKSKLADEELSSIAIEEKNLADISNDDNIASSEKDIATLSGNERKTNKKSNLSRAKSSDNQGNIVATDQFNLAMANYDKQDYLAAIELFKQSLAIHPAQDEVYFYLAKSFEKTNSQQDALSNYNKVISDKTSPWFEQALWNKSQILLNLDKRKSAINSLNQLKNLKGNYSKQAESILDSLLRH